VLFHTKFVFKKYIVKTFTNLALLALKTKFRQKYYYNLK